MSGEPPPDLNPKQEKALAVLLAGGTFIKAGEAAGVHESSVRRWFHEEPFKRAYTQARNESYGMAVSAVVRLVPMAVATFAKTMSDPNTPQAVKVQAAAHAMRFSREAIELDDLAKRLEALEEQLKAKEKTP